MPVTSSSVPPKGRSISICSSDSGKTTHSRPRAFTSDPTAKLILFSLICSKRLPRPTPTATASSLTANGHPTPRATARVPAPHQPNPRPYKDCHTTPRGAPFPTTSQKYSDTRQFYLPNHPRAQNESQCNRDPPGTL